MGVFIYYLLMKVVIHKNLLLTFWEYDVSVCRFFFFIRIYMFLFLFLFQLRLIPHPIILLLFSSLICFSSFNVIVLFMNILFFPPQMLFGQC